MQKAYLLELSHPTTPGMIRHLYANRLDACTAIVGLLNETVLRDVRDMIESALAEESPEDPVGGDECQTTVNSLKGADLTSLPDATPDNWESLIRKMQAALGILQGYLWDDDAKAFIETGDGRPYGYDPEFFGKIEELEIQDKRTSDSVPEKSEVPPDNCRLGRDAFAETMKRWRATFLPMKIEEPRLYALRAIEKDVIKVAEHSTLPEVGSLAASMLLMLNIMESLEKRK